MKVSTRITLGFALTVLLLIICTVTTLKTFSVTGEQLNDVGNVRMIKYRDTLAMRGALREMGIAARNIILFTDERDISAEIKRFNDHRAVFIRNLEALENIIQTDPISDELTALEKIKETEKPVLAALDQAVQLGKQNKTQESVSFLKSTVRPIQDNIMDAMDTMTELQMRRSHEAVNNTSSAISGATMLLIILTTLSVIISIVSGYIITRHLMNQLGGEPETAQSLAAAIAGGNLTTPVILRNNDTTSLLASLSIMQTQLHDLVAQIKDSATSVAMASNEIAQGNTDLSSRAEQQAAALQETAASMEQLTITVKSNTANAQLTAASARETVSLAQSGRTDVKKMTETMQDISRSSIQVRDITGIIEDIAFQTNILALNAAVEAARAGSEGRGFAVVAGEVRTLAQHSASAAKEIKELTERSVALVENGVELAEQASKSITTVVDMVNEQELAMNEIATASTEQMLGISQVNIAVNEMDGVTQSNAAFVEESSTASRTLSGQACSLREMVETFIV